MNLGSLVTRFITKLPKFFKLPKFIIHLRPRDQFLRRRAPSATLGKNGDDE